MLLSKPRAYFTHIIISEYQDLSNPHMSYRRYVTHVDTYRNLYNNLVQQFIVRRQTIG